MFKAPMCYQVAQIFQLAQLLDLIIVSSPWLWSDGDKRPLKNRAKNCIAVNRSSFILKEHHKECNKITMIEYRGGFFFCVLHLNTMNDSCWTLTQCLLALKRHHQEQRPIRYWSVEKEWVDILEKNINWTSFTPWRLFLYTSADQMMLIISKVEPSDSLKRPILYDPAVELPSVEG